MLRSIEVLGARVTEDGRVNWVSKDWQAFVPQELKPRKLPLVAPLSVNRLLLYGGKDDNGNVLSDGVIIEIAKINESSSFE